MSKLKHQWTDYGAVFQQPKLFGAALPPKPRGFAAMDPSRALKIQRKGGKTVAARQGHMQKLAAASVKSRTAKQ